MNGVELSALSIGAIFVYGGIKGKSPLAVILSVVRGQSPSNALASQGITLPYGGAGTSSGAGYSGVDTSTLSGIAAASNLPPGGTPQQALQAAAATRGWDTGAEWQALNNIEMSEAGYNPTIANPSSGALGMAQALGHGTANTAGTLGNQYGGYGLSDAQARLANSGDPSAQSLWMVNYIASRYGDPIAAWNQYHHADGSSWY